MSAKWEAARRQKGFLLRLPKACEGLLRIKAMDEAVSFHFFATTRNGANAQWKPFACGNTMRRWRATLHRRRPATQLKCQRLSPQQTTIVIVAASTFNEATQTREAAPHNKQKKNGENIGHVNRVVRRWRFSRVSTLNFATQFPIILSLLRFSFLAISPSTERKTNQPTNENRSSFNIFSVARQSVWRFVRCFYPVFSFDVVHLLPAMWHADISTTDFSFRFLLLFFLYLMSHKLIFDLSPDKMLRWDCNRGYEAKFQSNAKSMHFVWFLMMNN